MRCPSTGRIVLDPGAACAEARWVAAQNIDWVRYQRTVTYFRSLRAEGRYLCPGRRPIEITHAIFLYYPTFDVEAFHGHYSHHLRNEAAEMALRRAFHATHRRLEIEIYP
jgi:hypothetical protein